jgi:hypothetical protein
MTQVISGGATAADLEREVAKMLDFHTADDESTRQRAVAGILRVSPPAATLSLFIDGLIDRLVRSGDAVARRAAASLAGLGPRRSRHSAAACLRRRDRANRSAWRGRSARRTWRHPRRCAAGLGWTC